MVPASAWGAARFFRTLGVRPCVVEVAGGGYIFSYTGRWLVRLEDVKELVSIPCAQNERSATSRAGLGDFDW